MADSAQAMSARTSVDCKSARPRSAADIMPRDTDMSEMNEESHRLATFVTWPPDAPVNSERVARGGFFYTGRGYQVQCFSCGVRIAQWEHGDQVMTRHRAASPSCAFVLDPHTSGNVPATPGHANTRPDRVDGSCRTWRDMESLKSEAERLLTFEGWPHPFVARADLARAGFFYLKEGDRVRCAFCHGTVGEWEEGDVPTQEHLRHFPTCPFMNNLPVGNVPVGDAPGTSGSSPSEGGQMAVEERKTNPMPEKARELLQSIQLNMNGFLNGESLEGLGIKTHRGPRHPNFATYESRLRTFKGWPVSLSQKPETLAEAGFYYAGVSDHVKCFHCDGGLRNWDRDDDPWIEHGRWFTRCAFLLLVKGEDFVKEAVQNHPPVLPPCLSPEPQEPPNVTSEVPNERPRPTYTVREVSEEELNTLMRTPVVVSALEMGMDPSRIKSVLRAKMRQTGLPFFTCDALVGAALDMQFEQEEVHHMDDRDASGDRPTREDEIPLRLPALERWSDEDPSDPDTDSSDEDADRRPSSAPHGDPNHPDVLMSVPVEVGATQDDDGDWSPDGRTAKSLPPCCEGGGGGEVAEVTQQMEEPERAGRLEEENRRLKEARLCKICMDEEVGVVFLPCGHLISCILCAPALKDCPLCRTLIKGTVRAFLS